MGILWTGLAESARQAGTLELVKYIDIGAARLVPRTRKGAADSVVCAHSAGTKQDHFKCYLFLCSISDPRSVAKVHTLGSRGRGAEGRRPLLKEIY